MNRYRIHLRQKTVNTDFYLFHKHSRYNIRLGEGDSTLKMINQKTPLVSVIITFLNEERFLAEAVESVINQEYKNWELILVDDGSTDESTRIAKDFAGSYPSKIFYAEHQGHVNKGLSASRNYGISLSRGELIAFLDGDDIWVPAKLVVQISLMNENPNAAMLFEACEYWYGWQDKTKQDIVVQVGTDQNKLFNPPHLAETLYPLSVGDAPSLSGLLVKKSVLEKYGGFEEQFTGLYGDQAFLHKVYLNEPIYISSLCHHKYRQREGSIVQKTTSEGYYHLKRRFFLKWLQQYMLESNIKHEKVQLLLKKALKPYDNPFFYLSKIYFYPFIKKRKMQLKRLLWKSNALK